MKTKCDKCGQPLERERSGNKRAVCQKCKKDYHKEYYKTHKEKYNKKS